MVIWLWFGLAMVVATVAQVALLERRQRELQREKFAAAIRAVDGRCRRAGWILVDATFRPGWRMGRGEVTWRRGEEMFSSPVEIAHATREAATPW